ncbi:hypothetical protein C8J57DRAFT_1581104 [Mycena rebaudengoi]|nr:hypothetical protein C8J57DRAFT_1581104 [Mycena rebaudengoi]
MPAPLHTLAIAFLLAEVLLPPHVSLLAIPCKVVLQRVFPSVYTPDTPVHIYPYVSSVLLFVSVTTLALFFASGTYTDKIAYVPHANRALRSFNIYLNVRKPPLRAKPLRNPLAFFFPSVPPPPPPPSPSPIPPAANPRGELRLSSRVDRANFERKRAAQAQAQGEQARA